MIQLKDICKEFQTDEVRTLAVDHVNLEIKKGEFMSIMGPSGCGKSTLLNIMGLLDNPSEGTVVIDGMEIKGQGDRYLADLRNRKLGFIFQNFHLIPSLKVRDNVALPLLYGGRSVSVKEKKQRVEEVLEKVGLAHRMDHFPSQLSGGQCQRVAIARAIVGRPEILLADEPTGNLDSRMGEEIIGLLSDLNREGITIVMVTHDEHIALRSHGIIRMLDGKIVQG